MSIIQILIILFVLFAASRALLRFNDKSLGYGAFLFWSCIWGSVLLVTFQPKLSDRIANVVGIQRGTDVMFFLGSILAFYLIFRLYVKLDRLDKDITTLAMEVSKHLHTKK